MRFPKMAALVAGLVISSGVTAQEGAKKKYAEPIKMPREKATVSEASIKFDEGKGIANPVPMPILPPAGKITIAEAEAKGIKFDGIAKTPEGKRLQFTLPNGQTYQVLGLSIKVEGEYFDAELRGDVVHLRKMILR